MPTGSPKVTITEKNVAVNVQANIGAVGAMVVASSKGSFEPVLQGSVDQFLSRVTPNGRVRTSDDTSILEAVKFLEQSNKLYTVRPDNGAKTGGLRVYAQGSATNPVSEGFTDVDTYKGTIVTGAENSIAASALTFDNGQDYLTLSTTSQTPSGFDVHDHLDTGDIVRLTVSSGGSLPAPLQSGVNYFVIKRTADNKISLASSAENAENNRAIDITSSGVGTFTLSLVRSVTSSTFLATSSTDTLSNLVAGFLSAIKTGDPVTVSGTTLPGGLTASTTYYVIKGTNSIQLATTYTNATTGTGTAITLANDGSGTLTITYSSVTTPVTPDLSDDTATVSQSYWDSLSSGGVNVNIQAVNGSHPTTSVSGFSTWNSVYIVKAEIPGKVNLYSAYTDATNNTPIDVIGVASGSYIVYPAADSTPTSNVAVVFYGVNPGVWNNDIGVTITNYDTNPTLVREPNSSLLRVFYKGVMREEYHVSRDPDALSSNGRSMYVESVLNNSEYIRAFSNVALNGSIFMDDIATVRYLGGADDGAILNESDWVKAAEKFLDTDQYDIRVFSDSGHTTPNYQSALLDIAERRDDSIVILGVPYAEVAKSNYVKAILDYKNVTLNNPSSYGGLYVPHVLVLDRDNSRELYISGTGEIAGRWAREYDLGTPWRPVANETGILDVRGLQRNFNGAELDTLFATGGLNNIRTSRGEGFRVWGENTLDPRPTPLSRLHARVVLNYIKPPLKQALDTYLFSLRIIEDNAGTRSSVRRLIDNFMRGVKRDNGIYTWRTVINDDNNTVQDVQNRVLNVILQVQIIETIEYINVDIGITPYGTDFSLVESLI